MKKLRRARPRKAGRRTPWPAYVLGKVRWRKEHTIGVLLACAISLWVHLALFVAVPSQWDRPVALPEEKGLDLEIVSPVHRFVEVNPTAQEEDPGETDYFSSRAQKAAQPDTPEKVEGEDPSMKGDPMDAHKIVQGSFETPATASEPKPEMEPQEEVQKKEPKPLDEEGEPEVVQMEPRPWAQPSKASPQPRPKVVKTPVMGPLKTSKSGVANVGVLATNAKFSEFGVYIQQMNEAIAAQWIRLVSSLRLTVADQGTYVLIHFKINAKGDVVDIEVEESTAGASAVFACKDAVLSRAPFGDWTQEMKDTLEEPEALRVKFHYL